MGCGINMDKKKVIKLKITPAMKAVAIPLYVPTKRTGRPNVNSTSQNTCVRMMKDNENNFASIMRYDIAQIKLMRITSIRY